MWLYVFYNHTLISLRDQPFNSLSPPFLPSPTNHVPCSNKPTQSLFHKKNPNPQIPVSSKIQHAIYSKRNYGDDDTTLRPH
ncbi:hypothetical protein Hdeb2414_s0030g00707771 [Helianthus debilis subsp. tardiflorus]